MALSSDDKAWIHNDIKGLLEDDGAVARGLRAQPNNLSDGERGKLTDAIEKRLRPIIESVATDEDAITSGVVQGFLAAIAAGDASALAEAIVGAMPATFAAEVANQIMAKQGQAMVDAAGPTP